ncbi:hypothetical protein FRC14_004989 [Serendipita sp. 396]|nr:hypothetical protein FRC14_004989 [Serendipita sp. 396]KAG8781243.1 hypothetical protein FRC15_008938 [Serendipita sp. 397]KAG8798730.1 hypothetical protein FRC16_006631 [Serendipita sp. 398]KAG8811038.1 hypothetical protein FRC18_003702 [Serendipita sp. 400]KAG8867036.1 hypothetical protein FRC20_006854 [Serendipita sp. 405]
MVILDDKDQKWPTAPPPYIGTLNPQTTGAPVPGEIPAINITSPTTASTSSLPPSSPNQRVQFVTRTNMERRGSGSVVGAPSVAYANPAANHSTGSFVQQGHSDNPPPFPRRRIRITLLDLPQHVLLYILQLSCLPTGGGLVQEGTSRSRTYQYNPDAKGEYRGRMSGNGGVSSISEFSIGMSEEEEWAEHAQGLFHLAMSVRRACRALYVACMHILRSTYLPLYSLNIKSPYTSDPFPSSMSAPTYSATPYVMPSPTSPASPTPPAYSQANYMPSNSSPLLTSQRETRVLDQFLLLKLYQDVLSSESSLHLSGSAHPPSSDFSDLFSLLQPTARLEDLIRHYGLQNGSITLAPSSSRMVSFDYVSVKLSDGGRRVGLVVSDTKGRKRVLAEYVREHRDEKLEIAAKKLAKELLAILKKSRNR